MRVKIFEQILTIYENEEYLLSAIEEYRVRKGITRIAAIKELLALGVGADKKGYKVRKQHTLIKE